MVLLRDLILLITAFNAISSFMILIRWPFRAWPIAVAWRDHGLEKPDLKAKEERKPNEKALE